MKKTPFSIKYLYSLISSLMIISLSLIKTDSINQNSLLNIPHIDKIVHLGMYFALTSILLIENRVKNKIFITIITILFGGVMELSQQFLTSYRSGDYLDLLGNTTGSILALIVIGRFYSTLITYKPIQKIIQLKESIIQ